MERTAEALGRETGATERAGKFACELPSAPTMYLGVDGTGVPICNANAAGRAAKQADGSAKTGEGKVVVIWTAQEVDADDRRAMAA